MTKYIQREDEFVYVCAGMFLYVLVCMLAVCFDCCLVLNKSYVMLYKLHLSSYRVLCFFPNWQTVPFYACKKISKYMLKYNACTHKINKYNQR